MAAATIFVDANVYLDFFRSNEVEFHRLLEPLEALKDQLFITERVANEVRRGKIGVAASVIDPLLKQFSVPSLRLPRPFEAAFDDEYKQLNDDLASIHKQAKDLKSRLQDARGRLIGRIARSEDPTSQALERLFASARQPSPDQVERAFKRAKYGDPPGKFGDPVGDQLSWEQILDADNHGTHLCIVTRDGDYFERVGDELVLTPMLEREVGVRWERDKVKVFDLLLDAITFVQGLGTEMVAPTGAEAQEIRNEEKKIASLHVVGPRLVASGSGLATPPVPIHYLARALDEISRSKAPNESMLHFLLRGEQIVSIDHALQRAVELLSEHAEELAKKPP